MTSEKIPRYSVAIIGAGVSGMVASIQIQKQLGLTDFLIIEKSTGGYGGTWNDNFYPGAACDVLGHVYCFSFAPNPEWSKKWPDQPEIKAYFEKVAKDYNLAKNTWFGTEVVRGVWNEKENNWILTLKTSEGKEKIIIAKTVVSGVGQLNNPSYPNIPGLDTFKGAVVHSARWDRSAKYDGRVGVIGTGARQIVPELVKIAKKLYVYQRSPAYMMTRGNFKYSSLFKWLCRNVPFFNKIYRVLWLLALDRNFVAIKTWVPLIGTLTGLYLRTLIYLAVKDKQLRKKVTPDYPVGCKRILISDDWFPAIQKPNAALVTDHIVRITEDGIVTKNEKGQEEKQEVDTIVLATGFKALGLLEPMEFIGKNGQSLRKTWSTGAEAYKGYLVSGFPNLFVLYGPNTNLGHNSIIFMIESTMTSIIECMKDIFHKQNPTPYVNVKKTIQESYNKKVQADLGYTTFAADCASWYRQKDGKIITQWSGFVVSYWLSTRNINPNDFEQVGNKSFAHARSVQTRNSLITAAAILAGAGFIGARLRS
ncbi:hypothetical protein HDU97_007470 [Phlyctochytrium planicorne]|nr:hypothetical protein HDU97_007470 [Phlyctochytrium planicorne]